MKRSAFAPDSTDIGVKSDQPEAGPVMIFRRATASALAKGLFWTVQLGQAAGDLRPRESLTIQIGRTPLQPVKRPYDIAGGPLSKHHVSWAGVPQAYDMLADLEGAASAVGQVIIVDRRGSGFWSGERAALSER